MKSKPFDYAQSSVIPFRFSDGELHILMITSRRKRNWVFPKGLIDRPLSARQSALKEAEEEAGVIGDVVGEAVGTYRYRKWGGICRVEVFLMQVTRELDDWQEDDLRDRIWVSPGRAREMITSKKLRGMLKRALCQSCLKNGSGPHATRD